MLDIAQTFLDASVKQFRKYKVDAEKALQQISDEQLHIALDHNTNSAAVIMKHLAGNLRSRFTEFLATDGEKPNRNRDGEFEDDCPSRDELMARWESGWARLFGALGSLKADDLTRTITIRGEPHTVVDAIQRALAHAAYHVGQIIQLCRFLAKDRWVTITIPRGGSEAFNRGMR